MGTDARERLKAAVEAVVVKHGYFDNAELVEAARALLAEPPAGDAALLREFRDWLLHDMAAEESAHAMFRGVQRKLDELLTRAAKGDTAAAEPEPARLVKRLLDACKAKDDLLVCYRLGKHPSETLFKRLDKANKAIEEAGAALGRSS